jgi:hypothetical protein
MQAPMLNTAATTDDRRVERMMLDMALAKIQYMSTELADLRAAVATLRGGGNGAVAGVPRSVFFDADDVGPFERGFYQREFDGNGRAFRWTGHGEFVEFRFFIDRNAAYHFAINGQLYGGGDVGPVRAFVDYAEVPVEAVQSGSGVKLSGSIPPSPFATRATLTLWSPSRWVPEAGDERTLWFAFYDLTAEPVAEAIPLLAPQAAEPAAPAVERPADKPEAVAGAAQPVPGVAEDAKEPPAAPDTGHGKDLATPAVAAHLRAHRTKAEAGTRAKSHAAKTAGRAPALAEDDEVVLVAAEPSHGRHTWKQ